jgi:hypothetical protein
VRVSRKHATGRRRDENMPAHCLILILLALHVCAEPGHAQAGAGGAAVEWIRPEEVPARADALLRRLEAGRSEAPVTAALDRIEKGLADMGPNLDAALDRVSAALTRSALPGELDDVRRGLTGAAAPLAGWQTELADARADSERSPGRPQRRRLLSRRVRPAEDSRPVRARRDGASGELEVSGQYAGPQPLPAVAGLLSDRATSRSAGARAGACNRRIAGQVSLLAAHPGGAQHGRAGDARRSVAKRTTARLRCRASCRCPSSVRQLT